MFPKQLIEKIYLEKKIQKFGTGESIRDWMYVQDAVDAVFLAAHKPLGFQAFNVGTGKGTTLNDLIAIAEEVIGKPAIIDSVPVPAGEAHFVGIANNTKVRQLLGWAPTTSLKEGLAQTFDNFLEKKLTMAG